MSPRSLRDPASRRCTAWTPTGCSALAETLYGRAPEGYLVSVAAPAMEHVEGLSEIAEAASIEAASVVRALLAEHGGPSRL